MRSHGLPASKHLIIPLFLLGALSARAAEFTATVPAELVRLLTASEVYRDLPPGFPSFVMPEGLAVIGAQDRPGLQQVLLRSAPEGPAAQQAVVDDLMARGWIDMGQQRAERATGFVIPENTGFQPAELCHDELGVLQVRGETGVENRVYLRFTPGMGRGWQGCEAQMANRLGRLPADPQIDRLLSHLPDLPPPETSVTPPPFAPMVGIRSVMRIPGRSQPFENEVFVSAPDMDIEALAAHYAARLREQGWRRDAEWAGELTGGSQWTSSPEDGLRLFLRLTLSRAREGLYAVGLYMSEME